MEVHVLFCIIKDCGQLNRPASVRFTVLTKERAVQSAVLSSQCPIPGRPLAGRFGYGHSIARHLWDSGRAGARPLFFRPAQVYSGFQSAAPAQVYSVPTRTGSGRCRSRVPNCRAALLFHALASPASPVSGVRDERSLFSVVRRRWAVFQSPACPASPVFRVPNCRASLYSCTPLERSGSMP